MQWEIQVVYNVNAHAYFTLHTLYYVIDDNKNGVIQVRYTDGIYSLSLQGNIDEKQSTVALLSTDLH